MNQTDSPTALLDVGEVATLLSCSPRHVNRLSRSGQMPPPVRLGYLVRWSREAIGTWIQDGCPSIHETGTRGTLAGDNQ